MTQSGDCSLAERQHSWQSWTHHLYVCECVSVYVCARLCVRLLSRVWVGGNGNIWFRTLICVCHISAKHVLLLPKSYARTLTFTPTNTHSGRFSCCQVLPIHSHNFPVEYHIMSPCHVGTHILKYTSTFITCIMHVHIINFYHYAYIHNYTRV